MPDSLGRVAGVKTSSYGLLISKQIQLRSSSDPAAKEVVNDLGGFLRQGEEGGPASGEGGGALKSVGKRAN